MDETQGGMPIDMPSVGDKAAFGNGSNFVTWNKTDFGAPAVCDPRTGECTLPVMDVVQTPAQAPAAATERKMEGPAVLNAAQSPADMVRAGILKQGAENTSEKYSLMPGEKTLVNVGGAVQPADFVVHADGSVTVNGNPDVGVNALNIRVDAGTNPAFVDNVVKYVAARSNGNVMLNADQGSITPELQNLLNPQARPQDPLNPEDPNAPSDTPDDGGADDDGGGDCPSSPGSPSDSPSDCPDCSPSDDDYSDEEDDTSPSNDAPVSPEFSDVPSDGGISNISNNADMGWMYGDEIGHSPNARQLQEALRNKQSKLNQNLKAQMEQMRKQGQADHARKLEELHTKLENDPAAAQRYCEFLQKQKEFQEFQKNNPSATPEQLKQYEPTKEQMAEFGNKELQNAMTTARLAELSSQMNINMSSMTPSEAGQLAVAQHIGSVPTAQDMNAYAGVASAMGPSLFSFYQPTIAFAPSAPSVAPLAPSSP
ncbi:MAG: YlbF family regulator [Candidatus Obscuribacterales bacterium]|nr:YlbF family regulator [Candidatus Obscuribacterales bacterium]